MKRYLTEVTVLRPLAILLLVVMHSFTVYNGSWRPFEGFEPVEAYKWITRVTFSFMLELFVFISGYVLAFQMIDKGHCYTILGFARKKSLRLLLPSVLFSIIYLFWLYPTPPSSPVKGAWMILGGVGHLWFLPMLFWCFLLGLALIKSRLRTSLKIVLAVLLAISSAKLSFLPLRLGTSCYYLLFFYIGYLSFKHKDLLLQKVNGWCCLFFFSLYVVTFVITQCILDGDNFSGFARVAVLIFAQVGKIVYASAGMFAAYLIVMYVLRGRSKEFTPPHLAVTAQSNQLWGLYIPAVRPTTSLLSYLPSTTSGSLLAAMGRTCHHFRCIIGDGCGLHEN